MLLMMFDRDIEYVREKMREREREREREMCVFGSKVERENPTAKDVF